MGSWRRRFSLFVYGPEECFPIGRINFGLLSFPTGVWVTELPVNTRLLELHSKATASCP